MNDRREDGPGRGERPQAGQERQERQERGGPAGTEFLDLEISKVLYGEAAALTREAVRELLKESIKTTLQERLGPKLAAIAKIAADELADDIEANLAIEASIASRNRTRVSRDAAVQKALFQQDPPSENDK